ncbi:helix-turn-helix domain-containing protein [Aquincola sp. MAHUQ-54]|uniref:Helix-turn-helix domain-containing protein n=1 Tax=Aquincola agrisoli TaxID=3119538 RepID=A0AAW9Q120_9BURK
MDRHEEVKSAARVLTLLELFESRQVPLTLREIVELTGFPQSSTAALLATLIRKGYVAHDRRSHEYVPTARVAQLGSWIADDGLAAEPALQRAIEQLHRVTGETAVAAVRRGTYAQYVIVAQRARPKVVPTEPGVLRPVCSSGTGIALLSLEDDQALRRLVARAQRERRGIVKVTTLPRVREAVEQVRRHGFAMSRHGVFDGTGMIAMPLPWPVRGHPVAFGVGGPVTRLDAKMALIVRELRLAVQGVLGPMDP